MNLPPAARIDYRPSPIHPKGLTAAVATAMPGWFDEEVRELERRRIGRPPADDQVLFYGSSSLRLWERIESDFPGYTVVNHGFGGSTLADCLEYFDRLVVPPAPRAVILYAGDNDLDNGASPERVLSLAQSLIARTRDRLGPVPIGYVSIKLSPARFHIRYKISYTNSIIADFVERQENVVFIDVFRRMVGRGILGLWTYYSNEDPLHMNATGYRLWAAALREFLAEHCPVSAAAA